MSTAANGTNPYAPPKAHVQDVRPDEASFEKASRWQRLGAAFLDFLIAIVLVYGPLLATGSLRIGPDGGIDPAGFLGIGGVLATFGFLAFLGLTLYFVIKSRQTVGKKLVGIKVVRTDGSRISVSRLFWARNVVLGVLSMIPLLNIVLFLVDTLMIFGEPRQCLHDKIADTFVVQA